ncbi:MAG: NifU family protein [Flavobacteriia bacterium]|nr:MAG: NifU family protein [Flavobacteriia bacterium]
MENNEIRKKVEIALEDIRPYLIADGGNISLISIVDNTVTVRLEGTCAGCKVNQLTLKNGVEATIKKYVPEIERVIEEE